MIINGECCGGGLNHAFLCKGLDLGVILHNYEKLGYGRMAALKITLREVAALVESATENIPLVSFSLFDSRNWLEKLNQTHPK